MQTLSEWLARLCIWIVGLPSVSLEARRAEAAKAARQNVALAIGYRDEYESEVAEDDRPAATVVTESIEARGIGFGEYLLPECDCGCDDDDDQEGHR